MILKYSWIFLFYLYFSNGFEFFGLRNGFKYLIDEFNLIPLVEKFVTKTSWIKQKLDHFDPNETRQWNMRYFERLDLWRPNGPIYLFLGGESAVSPRLAGTGTTYELAKETQGAIFISEHRYYGESKPLNGTDAQSFKYLSARQALADNAHLLKSIKSLRIYSQSKVVVVGGSYSGNLAAWMKLLYPELVDAAIASSGPVLAKTDFYEYLEKVSDNYEQYGTKDCIANIKKKFERYNNLLDNTNGIEQLMKEENICKECNISRAENKYIFFTYKVSEFMINSQYGTTDKIYHHCKKLANVTELMTSQSDSTKYTCICYDYDEMIKQYYERENDWVLAWSYQICTEFGYFQTTTSDKQPFSKGMPLDFYIKMCSSLFGPDFGEKRVDDGVLAVNELYGALKPNVTQVVFTNGNLDPWSTLSILEELSYNAPAVVIPRASHCRDLFSDGDKDIEELREARKYVKYLIKKWIGAGDTGFFNPFPKRKRSYV